MTGVSEKVLAVERELLAPGSHFALSQGLIDGEPIEMFTNRIPNLRDVIASSVNFGDSEYLVETDGFTERRVTFAEHERLVASVAAALAERYGVEKGDRVAILGANSIDWIIAFWATVSLGAIACGLNGWWTRPEIEYAIEYLEPKVLITDKKRFARLDRTSPLAQSVTTLVIEDEFESLITYRPHAALPDTPIVEDDAAIILFTSGTTGRPKGAVHTHGNLGSLLAMLFFQGARAALSAPPLAEGAPTATCQFMTSPLFHVSGLHTGAVMFLAAGVRSVWWLGRFDPVGVAAAIEREKCTGWSVTETVLHRFVHNPEIAAGKFDLSAVRSLGGGGSAVPVATQELARKVFVNAAKTLGFGYGMTECTALATTNFGDELIAFPTSVGRPLPTVTIQVRDADARSDEQIPDGEIGEVWIRSPMVMKGYWNLPEATVETIFPRGWLRTGDFGYMLDGRLYLASRRTDLILRGGENIYPAEIEARLIEHESVDEVVVIGTPDPEYGEVVRAVVVLRAGAKAPTDNELEEFCGQTMAAYKVPTSWVMRSDKLPRNATGKVLRDELDAGASTSKRFVEE